MNGCRVYCVDCFTNAWSFVKTDWEMPSPRMPLPIFCLGFMLPPEVPGSSGDYSESRWFSDLIGAFSINITTWNTKTTTNPWEWAKGLVRMIFARPFVSLRVNTIRMVFTRKLTKGLANIIRTSPFAHSQGFVVVFVFHVVMLIENAPIRSLNQRDSE